MQNLRSVVAPALIVLLGLIDVGLAPLALPPFGLSLVIGLLVLEPRRERWLVYLGLTYFVFTGELVSLLLPLLSLGLLLFLRRQMSLEGVAAIGVGMMLTALGLTVLGLATLGGEVLTGSRFLLSLLLALAATGLVVTIGQLLRFDRARSQLTALSSARRLSQ